MAWAMTCDSGLSGEMSTLALRRNRAPIGGWIGRVGVARVGDVRGRVEELVEDDAVLQREPDRVVDDALAALAGRQALVGPDQAGQDRQARGVGRGPAEGAERVGLHVPDRLLVGVPLAVAVLAGPRGVVELVGDVVVLVPDDQVRVAAVVQPDDGAVLIVALEDRVGREWARPARSLSSG